MSSPLFAVASGAQTESAQSHAHSHSHSHSPSSSSTPLHPISSMVRISRYYHLLPSIDPNYRTMILLLLKQQNLAQLKRRFQAVSDPDSPEYGHYMTPDDIRHLVSPPVDQVNRVVQFLETRRNQAKANGINDNEWELNVRGDSIQLSTTVAVLEFLFRAKFSLYESLAVPHHRIARLAVGSSAFIPSNLMDIVEYIMGLGDFPPQLIHGPVRSNPHAQSEPSSQSQSQPQPQSQSQSAPQSEPELEQKMREYYDSMSKRRVDELENALANGATELPAFRLHHEADQDRTHGHNPAATEAAFEEYPRVTEAASLRDVGDIAQQVLNSGVLGAGINEQLP